MQSVNPSIKPFCSLLRETTRVWLLLLCLPSLTESEGIDGPRQSGALTFHTLVQGFLTRGARNVPRGCGDAESLRLIRPILSNTKKRYVTDFKFTSGK